MKWLEEIQHKLHLAMIPFIVVGLLTYHLGAEKTASTIGLTMIVLTIALLVITAIQLIDAIKK